MPVNDLANYIPALKFKKAKLRLRDLEGAGILTTGNIFYVDSVTGSSVNPGDRPDKPVATIDQAVNLTTANKGDVILVMPKHAETLSSATALNLDVAGITIKGLGIGSNRPTITLDTAVGTTIPVSAADIAIENCIITANFADITSAFTLTTAKNFRLDTCSVLATAANMNFLHVIDLNTTDNAADGLTVVNSFWNEPDAATLAFALIDGSVDRINISDNVMYTGAQTVDIAFLLTCGAKNLTGARIIRNYMQMIGNASTAVGLIATSSGTASNGIVADNYIKHLTTSGDLLWSASTKLAFHNNYASGVVDKSGYLLPAADS